MNEPWYLYVMLITVLALLSFSVALIYDEIIYEYIEERKWLKKKINAVYDYSTDKSPQIIPLVLWKKTA